MKSPSHLDAPPVSTPLHSAAASLHHSLLTTFHGSLLLPGSHQGLHNPEPLEDHLPHFKLQHIFLAMQAAPEAAVHFRSLKHFPTGPPGPTLLISLSSSFLVLSGSS